MYLAKPYFHTLLQEAAKDHYAFLKKAFGRLTRKLLSHKRGVKSKGVSKLFSVRSQTVDGFWIVFLLEDGYPQELSESCLRDAHALMLEHYRSHPNDKLTRQISALAKQSHSTKVLRYGLRYEIDTKE